MLGCAKYFHPIKASFCIKCKTDQHSNNVFILSENNMRKKRKKNKQRQKTKTKTNKQTKKPNTPKKPQKSNYFILIQRHPWNFKTMFRFGVKTKHSI